ncbi:MAG: alpha/beta fold hydrolase [Gaiellaceae bacterium]
MADLHVREWGDRDGTPILFWHALGAGGSGETIAEIAPVLVRYGYRVLALDGPGFGESPLLPPERYTAASLASAALSAADEHGADRFVFIGHSWGGSVALATAAAAPTRVRALVLVDSGHIDYGSLPDVPRQTVEEWVRQAESRGHTGDHARATGAAMWGLAEQPVSEYWPSVAEHRIPTLLLLATVPPHAAQNREHAPRFEAALPHAEVRWVPEASHGLLADAGPPLGDELAAWLEAVA